MKELLTNLLSGKKIAIAGFGREGQSTFKLIRKYLPTLPVDVLDNNAATGSHQLLQNDQYAATITGSECFQSIDLYDVVIKSPGIPSRDLPANLKRAFITSQADIFLQQYGRQTIGITGTKGKSTTSSLIAHILQQSGKEAILAGNIGLPPFEIAEQIIDKTMVVMELSSHQLEFVTHSPHIGILLNIFQEHLDHYHSYENYQQAKMNILKFMNPGDYFIYNIDNELLKSLVDTAANRIATRIPFSHSDRNSAIFIQNDRVKFILDSNEIDLMNSDTSPFLKGKHNLYNIMAAASACYLCGLAPGEIAAGIRTFKGLEHRIELVGTYSGIVWYNDSIATIPEATIEALKALQTVDTLILGGFDRGIDYHVLYDYLQHADVSNLIFTGEAGNRMLHEYVKTGNPPQRIFRANDYSEVISMATAHTAAGMICLLSPAAASYDMFKNFEERGNVYKTKVRELGPSL